MHAITPKKNFAAPRASSRNIRYAIVSPVKDEGAYIEETLKSVLNQTLAPRTWVIVDDGSNDGTAAILEDYASRYPLIQTVSLKRGRARQPGGGVIRAFNRGYEGVAKTDCEYIVKLDCDLRFEPSYFEQLFSRFREDGRLGIASGVYLERRAEGWTQVKMPPYHAAGASKVVRRECFEDIGGFVSSRGWDTIDEIRAQIAGWRTRHFPDLKMYHLKHEGTGIGRLRTSFMHGEIYYFTGGSKVFLPLKVLHRMAFSAPPMVGGFLMLLGYLKPLLSGKPLLVSQPEAKFYRRLLRKRLVAAIRRSRMPWSDSRG